MTGRISLVWIAPALMLVGCGVSREEFQLGIAEVQRSMEDRHLAVDERFQRESERESAALEKVLATLDSQVNDLHSRLSSLVDAVNVLNENDQKLSSAAADLSMQIQETEKELTSSTADLESQTQERFLSLENHLQTSEAQIDTRLSEVEEYDQTFRHYLDLGVEQRELLLGELVQFVDDYNKMLDQSSAQILSARDGLQARLDQLAGDSVVPKKVEASIAEVVPAEAVEVGSSDSQ